VGIPLAAGGLLLIIARQQDNLGEGSHGAG
jgi:hypothetical protein